jgi:hypothetical protein
MRCSTALFAGGMLLLVAIQSVNAAETAVVPQKIQKMVVPQFTNVDQAIGWVKAKGSCETKDDGLRTQTCRILVELPDQEVFGEKDKRWKTSGFMAVYETGPKLNLAFFAVAIIRTRSVYLVPTDSRSLVISQKQSTYRCREDGKL